MAELIEAILEITGQDTDIVADARSLRKPAVALRLAARARR